jgi:hypothetical protein
MRGNKRSAEKHAQNMSELHPEANYVCVKTGGRCDYMVITTATYRFNVQPTWSIVSCWKMGKRVSSEDFNL